MSQFAIRFFVALTLIIATGGDYVDAQLNLPFRKKNQSNTNSGRDLTIKNGPWLIMCASFSGENAEETALQLINELKRNKLKAYLYRHTFDYSGSFQGLGWQEPDADGNFKRRPIKMKSANLDVVQETAVLVGDFPSPDDGRAQQTLKQVKELQISNIEGLVAPDAGPQTPLRTAFMLPNPLLPEDYFRQPRIDEFIFKINKKLEYSLLKCPGLYSVKIASFRGQSIIDQQKIRNGALAAMQKEGNAASRLLDAEEKAHNLTNILRKKGVEAYEFHDRNESFVCIGSFDWVTRETNDRVMNNPDIVKIVDACKPEVKNLPGAPNSILPKSLRGIPLDPQPTPIMVPKYDRSKRTGSRLGFLKR